MKLRDTPLLQSDPNSRGRARRARPFFDASSPRRESKVIAPIPVLLVVSLIPFSLIVGSAAQPVRMAAVEPYLALARAWGEAAGIEIQVQSYPPNECIRRTGRGEFELAILPETLTEGQRQSLGARPGRVPQSYAVGWEAATLIVHPDNPLPFIEEPQVRGLFAPEDCKGAFPLIRSWNEILGLEAASSNRIGRIVPRLQTPEGEQVQKLLLGDCAMDEEAYQVSGDAMRERIVAASPEAVGVVYRLRYTGKARPLPVLADEETSAATPETATLNSGAYPFGRRIWLATPRLYYNPEPAAKLIAFALSPEGQFEVARMGFFPVR